MEFVWQGAETTTQNNNLSILAHVLDHHYSSPRGMDFEQDPPIRDEQDLMYRAKAMVEELRDVSRGYPSKKYLMQLAGDDFKWQDAKTQVRNELL
jgi:hypothetical protein